MKENFEAALAETLKHEGAFSNHPKDPGGATMKGVTQRVYDAWRSAHGLEPCSVKLIAELEVDTIYRRQYWDAIHGDELPAGVDAAIFDAAVNSGPVRAAKWLQVALGVAQDGHIGLLTLQASRQANGQALAAAVCDKRLSWLKRLKTFSTFGRGWTRRVRAVRTFSIALAQKGLST